MLFLQVTAYAESRVDSLCRMVPALHGAEKQKAMSELRCALDGSLAGTSLSATNILLAAVLLAVIVSVAYFFVRRRQSACHLEASAAEVCPPPAESTKLTSDQQLYRRINEIIGDRRLYLDKELNREQIASLLNTNPTYVANAIKECSGGLTVSDFINRFRLRHAADILVRDHDKSVAEIGEESGFSSRATFSRQFRDLFGMSASDYRKESENIDNNNQIQFL